MSYPLSIGSHRNESKRASYLKISQSFLQYPLTYTREFRVPCTTENQLNLQIVYEFPSTVSADWQWHLCAKKQIISTYLKATFITK